MARPEGFEPPTTWFVARYSIQLSYGRLFVRRGLWCLLAVLSIWPTTTAPVVWRRERDSNPRWSYKPHTPLAGERLQPLGHLSKTFRGAPMVLRTMSGSAIIRDLRPSPLRGRRRFASAFCDSRWLSCQPLGHLSKTFRGAPMVLRTMSGSAIIRDLRPSPLRGRRRFASAFCDSRWLSCQPLGHLSKTFRGAPMVLRTMSGSAIIRDRVRPVQKQTQRERSAQSSGSPSPFSRLIRS